MHLIGTPCSESLLSIRSNVEEVIELSIETDEPIIILYPPIVLKSDEERYFVLLSFKQLSIFILCAS